jgi:hypothetical protein
MKRLLNRTVWILLLIAYSDNAFPDFEESSTALRNSIYLNIPVNLSVIHLHFYTPDTGIIAKTERRLATIKLKPSPIPFQNSSEIYLGVYFLFLDDQPLIKDSTTYTIYNGIMRFGKLAGPKFNVMDSGRALERFFLDLASQSKVIDTQNWHRPLTIFIPDSLFGTTETINGFPDIYYKHPVFYQKRAYIFDPRGRRVSETGFGHNQYGAGVYILQSTSYNRRVVEKLIKK